MMDVFYRIFSDFPMGLMVSELVFARYYPKRSRFWLRALVTAIPFWAIYALAAQTLGTDSARSVVVDKLMIILVMVLTGLWLWLCYACDLHEYLFCLISAYAVQNMHHNLLVNLEILVETLTGKAFLPMQTALFSLILMVVLYTAAYFLLVRRLDGADISHVDRTRLMVNSLFFLLMTVFFIPDLSESFSVTRLLNFLYYLAADALVLFVMFGLLSESRQSKELDILEQLLYAEQRKQAVTQETIDIINMKCHDLKHQIARLRQGNSADDEYIREVENAIQIYDISVKTGNDMLDNVLMEKLLYCEKYDIQLTCMADGEKLGFMKSSDIYSLFGNALDNAIESVIREEDVEKRIISFNVSGRERFLKIHIENYLSGELEIKDGLPVTTKADKKYHGYGMMSIRHIVQKYSGELSVSCENGVFALNIVIPTP